MSGFVTKSMILYAAAEEHLWVVWLVLLFASAGVLDHSGIKIPFFTFFAHDSGKRCEEAPLNMRLAMGVIAFACIAIGVYPQALYALLPYAVEYHPYTGTHVITQLQLLLFSAMAFAMLFRSGLYPPEIPGVNLDSDWLYRRALPRLWRWGAGGVSGTWQRLSGLALHWGRRALGGLLTPMQDDGSVARTWSTSTLVLIVALVLGLWLLQAATA